MAMADPRTWATPFHHSPGDASPRVVRVFVEVPKGSRNKYELDKHTGSIKLDRMLYSASHYPGDYGFVPGTYADDGDPLDALVMLASPTFSGCSIDVRVVGLFRMLDGGDSDCKILGVPDTDPLFSEVNDLGDVPAHFLREVEYFFSTYKTLEGGRVEPQGWGDVHQARATIETAVAAFRARTLDSNLD